MDANDCAFDTISECDISIIIKVHSIAEEKFLVDLQSRSIKVELFVTAKT